MGEIVTQVLKPVIWGSNAKQVTFRLLSKNHPIFILFRQLRNLKNINQHARQQKNVYLLDLKRGNLASPLPIYT